VLEEFSSSSLPKSLSGDLYDEDSENSSSSKTYSQKFSLPTSLLISDLPGQSGKSSYSSASFSSSAYALVSTPMIQSSMLPGFIQTCYYLFFICLFTF
jgi:hypothetical protein